MWLTNSSLAAVTLTNGGNNASSTFAGAFRGSGNIVKTGAGTLTLAGTNAHTGTTIIAGGTMKFGAVTNVIATLQPALWFNFDSASSTIVTNLGNGGWSLNGAIIGNGAYLTNAGRFGNALYINGDGTNNATNIVFISSKVVDTSAIGNWSVGYWIKTTTAGAVIMYQGDGTWSSSGQTTYLLNANSGGTPGTYAGAVRWAGGFLTGTTALNDGNWHFITLVDSFGSEIIYVDGSVNSASSTMSLALASGANQIWIGGAPDTDAGACKMTGLIDEVCLFSRALSAAEVRAIYTNAPVVGKLPAASAVSVAAGATLDLSGIAQSVASLSDYNGAGGVITNNSGTPVTLVVGNNNAGAPNFSGLITDGSAANAVSLVKSGGGTQVLSGANNFHGQTTVSNGTLVVNGKLGTNAVAVRAGTLAGNGTIAGPVTIYDAGTLSPGSNTIGALTISNSLTLSGTTYIELDPSVPTNDAVYGVGTVNYGGTLTVANLGGSLAAGDNFKIFYATNYNGSFAALNLPPLGTNLVWNTNALASGVLSVVRGAVAPQVGQVSLAGTNLVFSGGGGAAAYPFSVLVSPDLTVPLTNWNLLGGGTCDTNGNFIFSNGVDPQSPQLFYEIKIQ